MVAATQPVSLPPMPNSPGCVVAATFEHRSSRAAGHEGKGLVGGFNTLMISSLYPQNNNIRREGSLRRLNGAAKSVGAKKPLAPANAQVSTGTGPVPRYMQGTAATKARVKGIA